jgi:hypothetical protein
MSHWRIILPLEDEQIKILVVEWMVKYPFSLKDIPGRKYHLL